MSIKIDDLELNKRNADDSQGTINEIKSVRTLAVGDKRRLLENRIASTYGSIIEDLGRHAMKIAIAGEFVGEGAKQGITTLRAKYRTGDPLPFTSDMTLLAQVSKVMIEDLKIRNLSGIQNRYEYYMVLREYKEPPPPPEEAPNQDREAQQDAQEESEVDDIRGEVLDADRKPVKGAKVKIKGPDGERQVETDDQGYYEILEVPEGKYEITIDAPGYEDEKRVVEIKKSGVKT